MEQRYNGLIKQEYNSTRFISKKDKINYKYMEIIMSRKKGQIFTAEQKSKIVLELIKEEQTVSQLASKHQVTSKTITNWKKQLLDNIAIAFEPAHDEVLIYKSSQ